MEESLGRTWCRSSWTRAESVGATGLRGRLCVAVSLQPLLTPPSSFPWSTSWGHGHRSKERGREGGSR